MTDEKRCEAKSKAILDLLEIETDEERKISALALGTVLGSVCRVLPVADRQAFAGAVIAVAAGIVDGSMLS